MKKRFLSINFHRDTVTRFKQTCVVWEYSYTEVLEAMLDFFDRYQLTPFDTFHASIRETEINLKKRINAIVAILKDIEKHQTQPSVAMLQLLFEQLPQEKSTPLIEIKAEDPNPEYAPALALLNLKKKHQAQTQELQQVKLTLRNLLYKTSISKGGFGKPKLILELPIATFESLKQHYK